MFNIVEKFLSVDGEGDTSGQIATFIRFTGCNLRCNWCDTTYSFNEINEVLTRDEIYEYIKSTKSKNVTLTGGEPLLQDGIGELLEVLSKDESLLVHVETNGSINIKEFIKKYGNINYIVDFKLPQSNMMDFMRLENLNNVRKNDIYKFVIANKYDLETAYKIIIQYGLTEKCKVYFSPVLGEINPLEIVEFMKEKKLNNVTFQIQLHKVIWHKNERGV